MKKLPKYIMSMLSMIFMFACEKEIDLAINSQPKLVVNALFNPDSVWSVHVSRSTSIISPEVPPAVNDAVVELYEDGELLEVLTSGVNGHYRSSAHKPLMGKMYQIQVKDKELGLAEATEKMEVEKVNISAVEYINVRDANLELPVTVQFKDPAGVRNFYIIKVYSVDEKGVVYSADVRSDELTASSKKVSLYGVGFSDALFDGKEYRFKLKIFYPYPKIMVELQHVSEAYYQYHATQLVQYGNTNDPFANPTELFNNISNGLGIFAAYQSDSTLVLPDSQ